MNLVKFVESLPVALQPQHTGIVAKVRYGTWEGAYFAERSEHDKCIGLNTLNDAVNQARQQLADKMAQADKDLRAAQQEML